MSRTTLAKEGVDLTELTITKDALDKLSVAEKNSGFGEEVRT